MHTNTNESGRSLIEMLAVISVISMITIGAISGMQYGLQTFRANSAYDLVETSAHGVIDLFSWKRGFTTNGTFATWICDNDIIEGGSNQNSGCINGKNAVTSTGWGDMIISPINDSCFEITLTDVPQRGCELLSNMTWRYAQHGTCEDGFVDWECSQSNNITFFVE